MTMRLLRLVLSLTLLLPPAAAHIGATTLHSPADSTAEAVPVGAGLRHVLREGVPLMSIGVGYNLYNSFVRDVRQSYTPLFKHRYDDYTQFVPLLGQLSLRMASVKGRSDSWGKMLSADALATAAMLGVVTTTKYLTHVRRPDGSADNSFPSGHTAMAFTSATLLHLEYGERYPWLSGLAYTASTITGVGRILNNRHWIGDVVTGAGVGIVSAYLGYWLSDLIFGSGASSARQSTEELCWSRLELYTPVQYGIVSLRQPNGLRNRLVSTSIGLGLQYRFAGGGRYLAQLEAQARSYKLENAEQLPPSSAQAGIASALMLGREWSLYKQVLSASMLVGAEVYVPHTASEHGAAISWSPKLQLSPELHFSPHLALRVNLSYLYRPASVSVPLVSGGGALREHLPRWGIGSSIVVRL